jgi:hypothetical protein
MNICSENNIVFIYIGGVSSSDEDFTKKYTNRDKEYIFESVSYISSKSPYFVINDLLTGRRDARNLSDGTTIKTDSARKAIRLNKLISIISFYMKYTDKKIVVIGVSHGSLIVHSAILKIKAIYEPVDDLMNIFTNRIIVLTLGSPKYLPKTLLKNKISDDMEMIYGNVYNFYNVRDTIYSVLNTLRTSGINNLSYLTFPTLTNEKSIDVSYTSISDREKILLGLIPREFPKYKFDTENHIFFVKNTENLKYIKETPPNDYLIKNLSESILSIIFYHSVLFHFFPIFIDNLHIIHYMRNITLLNKSSLDDGGNLENFNRDDIIHDALNRTDTQTGGKKILKIKKILKRIHLKSK